MGTLRNSTQQPTLGQRIDRTLTRMMLFAEGPAVDPSRDIVASSKSSTQRPPDTQSLAQEWAGRIVRLVESAEQAADDHAKGVRTVPHKTATDLRRVIRTYEGRDVVTVAYLEGCSVDLVRKVRSGLGLEAATGFRRPPSLTSRDLPDIT